MQWLKPKNTRFLPLTSTLALAVLSLFPQTARAESYTVPEESDWYFSIDEDQTLVIIYGNSNRECNEPGADPYLWLYDSNNSLISQDDDSNHGAGQCVSSKIYITLNAGDYRLRAGYYPQQQGL